MKYFTGCNKAFCNIHGVGHFTNEMIDTQYLDEQRLKDLDMTESDIALFRQIHLERTKVANSLMLIRFCRDCEHEYTSACKK